MAAGDWDVVRPALVAVLRTRNSPPVEDRHPVEFLWSVHDQLPAQAYPEGVVPALTHIRGTAAFPGGTGLVMESAGELPPFPYGGVMVIARDLAAEDRYLERARSGRPHGDPRSPMAYWRSLYRIFGRAGLDPRRCFFTNLYVGLRRGASPSGPFPGRKDPRFVRWCHAFLELQAEYMEPALVVFLGDDARKAYNVPGGVLTRVRLGAHEGPAVGLAHPARHHLTARARRYAGLTGPDAEVALLGDAVARMQGAVGSAASDEDGAAGPAAPPAWGADPE